MDSGASSETLRLSIIERMQNDIDRLLAPLVRSRTLARADFPDHSNVGDSAIWLGEANYLNARSDCRVAQVRKLRVSGDDINALGDGVLCLHGGGNFGDLWPRHQIFRESLMMRFPGTPIVQLPQSIHFRDSSNIDTAARAIAAHGDVTLLVRDAASLELARAHFACRSELCPDMAFWIGPVARTRKPAIPVLGVLRQDQEARGSWADSSIGRNIVIEDWLGDDRWDLRIAKVRGLLGSAYTFNREKMRRGAYDSLARARFNRGVHQLSRARVIVTDRLHVHIVSLLMGIPHAVLDNSYGKISGFMNAFQTRTPDVHVASSLADAIDWASERTERPV